MVKKIEDNLVIVLVGEAGQGIKSIESILSNLLKRSGYNYFSTSEVMSRVRGGANSTEIRVSSKPIAGFIDRIDILIPLHKDGIDHLKKRITKDTIVIGEKDKINYEDIIDVQFTEIAKEIGNAIYSNTVAAGLICGLLKVELKLCKDFIVEYFSDKSEEIQNKNRDAIIKGHKVGSNLSEIKITIEKSDDVKKHLLMTGAEAVSLGALAGGCNYICGYPMSPATSVFENMASHSKNFDIIVEQVEDEVGVINMALGAWYAGARAMTTTSGGGVALMSEGISLCGMIESPLVLHLAQRPGPATGLPTRTEQGDLNLVLHAGHGDFPRIILAPGTLEEGFTLTQKAFKFADKYQVPVFILTDQFFVDSRYNTPVFDTTDFNVDKHIVKTKKDYKRFSFTKTGISPRGIPSYGSGNVCVDSDEHDESGHITENFDIRTKMVNKRLGKFELIKDDIIPPKLIGSDNYKTLILCWGSTFNIVTQAIDELENKEIAVLHFSWIFPLSKNIDKYLTKASNLIVVENNSSGQFAQLLELSTGHSIQNRILKYNGLPFSVEEVKTEIQKFI
ncbi:MAG: 2-oxoacid:acceptor oxidoreductase subunit alpha [Candidatus Cloacimonetes bacterium]|nr:2-oxoacid:acceptor oxidoreductase subunit alpha [Candidatus Cloacimonadota bacterium]